MSKRFQAKVERERIHREIEQVRDALESHRPMDQEQRAELARTAQRLLHEARELRDQEARRKALALFERALTIAYPGGFWRATTA